MTNAWFDGSGHLTKATGLGEECFLATRDNTPFTSLSLPYKVGGFRDHVNSRSGRCATDRCQVPIIGDSCAMRVSERVRILEKMSSLE